MANWVRQPDGSFRDMDQHVPWEEILEWQVKMFIYSCYLYYELDSPKLSDEQFDQIVSTLEKHFDELPEWLREAAPTRELKPIAHAIKLDEQEIKEAIEWRDWSGPWAELDWVKEKNGI